MDCCCTDEGATNNEEAEYAWLTAASLKPFNSGDLYGDAEAPRTGDTTLQACVAAAERAMHANIVQASASLTALAVRPLGGSRSARVDFHSLAGTSLRAALASCQLGPCTWCGVNSCAGQTRGCCMRASADVLSAVLGCRRSSGGSAWLRRTQALTASRTWMTATLMEVRGSPASALPLLELKKRVLHALLRRMQASVPAPSVLELQQSVHQCATVRKGRQYAAQPSNCELADLSTSSRLGRTSSSGSWPGQEREQSSPRGQGPSWPWWQRHTQQQGPRHSQVRFVGWHQARHRIKAGPQEAEQHKGPGEAAVAGPRAAARAVARAGALCMQ